MKFLTLLLIPLLFLSSCTIDWDNEKDKKIAELEKQIQDDTFKKKLECRELSLNTNNLEKYEKIYSKELSTCYFIAVTNNPEWIRYAVKNALSGNYPYSIKFNNEWKIIKDSVVWFDLNKLWLDTSEEMLKSQCEFNKIVKTLKGASYSYESDFFSVNCK